MSVTFLESFDNWTTITSAVLAKWQSVFAGFGPFISIVAGAGRNGTAGLQMNTGSSLVNSLGSYLQRGFTTTTRMIIGMGIKVTTFGSESPWLPFSFIDGATNQISLSIDQVGFVRLLRGGKDGTILATSSSPVFNASGVYFYLELDVTFHGTLGAYTLRSNGVQIFTATNQNTSNTGNNQANGLRLGLIGNTAGGLNFTLSTVGVFEDLYVIDPTVGVRNLAFLGDTRVFASFPNADGGTLQFTPSPNQAHYLNVREAEQDGDATYNFDANALDVDLYQHTPTPASTGTVFAVQLCQVSRKDDAAARSTSNYLKSGASVVQGAVDPLSQSYAWYLDIIEVDPATTNPFTKAGIDAAQIGVIVAA